MTDVQVELNNSDPTEADADLQLRRFQSIIAALEERVNALQYENTMLRAEIILNQGAVD